MPRGTVRTVKKRIEEIRGGERAPVDMEEEGQTERRRRPCRKQTGWLRGQILGEIKI